MGRLEGKVIAIGGGGSGIGAGVARRYAAEGASVMIGDLDVAAADALAKEIQASGGVAEGFAVDIGVEESVAGMIAATESRFGGLDAFHANAADFGGQTADGTLLDSDPVSIDLDIFDRMMRTNARGYLLCTRHAVPALRRRGGGALLYTSSGAAHSPMHHQVTYAMGKASVHALMRHVALHYGGENIRANVIAPGVIITPKLESVFVGKQRQWAEGRIAIKTRLGRVEDIAAMATLLVSDEGAYVTGQVISVDGGGTMRS